MFFCVLSSVFCLSHFSVGCRLICWICGSIHCVHSLVIENPWTKCGSIHQDRYHLALTLRNFREKIPAQFFPLRALERNLDWSTKIDTTYPLVKKIHVFALGLVSFFKGGLRGKIVIPCKKNSKSPIFKNPFSILNWAIISKSFKIGLHLLLLLSFIA